MRGREPIVPQRRRRVPPQFSWVDHRLVRDGHVQGRSASALALYLFLVTVADADGLSWYSEESLCRQLSCEAAQLHRDRNELQQAELIAYRKSLYQVLDLAPVLVCASPAPRRGGGREPPLPREATLPRPTRLTWGTTSPHGEAVAVGEILKSILGGTR